MTEPGSDEQLQQAGDPGRLDRQHHAHRRRRMIEEEIVGLTPPATHEPGHTYPDPDEPPPPDQPHPEFNPLPAPG